MGQIRGPSRTLRRGASLISMDRIATAIAAGGLDVQPFQRRFLAGAFRPGITTAALTMARGGGKTELVGRLAALAVVPGSPLYRPGCECIVVAGSMRQAALTYKAAKRALPDTVKFRTRTNNHEISIGGPDDTAVTVYPSNGKRLLGLGAAQHLLIADEPGSWNVRDGDLIWAALTGALGKIEGQRVIVIGTISPAEAGSWWPRLVAAGSDPTTYVQIHAAAKADGWDSMKAAERANPLLRTRPGLRAVVKGERDKARRDPELQPGYEAFRLNRHRSADNDDLVTPAEWAGVLDRPAPPREGAAVLGVDLGATRSWSAAALAWQNGRLEVYASIPGLPDLAAQERRDGLARGTLARLVDRGVVVVADGKHIASGELVLDALPADVEIAGVVADRFASGTLIDALADRGLPDPEWRVNQWSTASEDIAHFREAVLDGPLSVAVDGRELSTLSIAASRVERDTSGNKKLRKSHKRRRDDVSCAAVLAVSALARWPKPVPLRVLTLA